MKKTLFALCFILFYPAASLADVTLEGEYGRRINPAQTVQPYGEKAFGENINIYTGDLSFWQTDVSLEGTGPAISLVRKTADYLFDTSLRYPHPFGNWTLSIPRIQTLADPNYGWVGESTRDANQRCSNLEPTYYSVLPYMGWYGTEMITESGDRQPLLKRSPQNTLAPTMVNANGQPIAFPIVTQQNWQVACLPNTANGKPGQGFLAVSPNGTKYWFDTLVYHPAHTLYENDDGTIIRQPRSLATMYVSRIEDRFGNSLTYRYNLDWTLKDIMASDGRLVSIAWRTDQRLIDSITVQPTAPTPRVWRYEYSDIGDLTATLSAVVLPDGSRWSFDLHGIGEGGKNPGSKCNLRTLTNSTATTQSTITSPSGLTGTFLVADTWHGRNYVPSDCLYPTQGGEPWEDNPPLFGTKSLTRKEISGAGVTPQVWTYSYQPAVGSTTSDACASTNTCPTSKWVKVTDPFGNLVTYTHSNRWDATEGKLLRVDSYQGSGGSPIRSEVYSYASYNQGPWPTKLGISYGYGPMKDVTWTPQKTKITTQQGSTLTWQATAYDEYARPMTVTRSSNVGPGYTRTDSTTYYDNLPLWVIGQVTSSKNIDTGLVESRTVFDEAIAMPVQTFAFGKLQQSLTYDTTSPVATGQRGTLKSVSDARDTASYDTTITASSWKRGIPQSVTLPDGNTKSVVVDDFGQVQFATDETGATTCYTYDAMGRLDSITYPSDTTPQTCDTSKWAPTTITLQRGYPAAYGLPTGHWRQTTLTGDSRRILLLDAFWRPVVEQTVDLGNIAGTTREVIRRYAADGNIEFESYPMNTAGQAIYTDTSLKGIRTTYDALGRPTRIEQDSELGSPLITTIRYLTGFLRETTDARLNVMTESFRVFDTPSFDNPTVIDVPENARITIGRDVFGKPTSVTRGPRP